MHSVCVTSLKCTRNKQKVLRCSPIHPENRQSSPSQQPSPLVRGQQEKRVISSLPRGDGCDSAGWAEVPLRGRPGARWRQEAGGAGPPVGHQSQSSLHTQEHSSWCSRDTSVMDFCRPLPPPRCFNRRTSWYFLETRVGTHWQS